MDFTSSNFINYTDTNMTQEEKDLLLKDLCGRLPYGVKIHINSYIEEQNQMQLFDVNLDSETIGVGNKKWVFRAIPIIDDEDETKVIKPYLRPMSSMTEEEFQAVCDIDKKRIIFSSRHLIWDIDGEIIDYFNRRMLDWRGLIHIGLALEAPEDMYKEN